MVKTITLWVLTYIIYILYNGEIFYIGAWLYSNTYGKS